MTSREQKRDAARVKRLQDDVVDMDKLRQERAQVVLDCIETLKKKAKENGEDPLDLVIDEYLKQDNELGRDLMRDAAAYLRFDQELGNRGTGPEVSL